MQIGEERSGAALVIAPAGRVDSVSSNELERLVVARLDAGERRIVVDLAQTSYISSAGLRVLLLLAKRLKPPAGALVLCGMGPSVRTVLELAGFLPLFAVEPARAEALSRIEAAAAP
jgi:stage II sporulation protein AA (anti-sigma F factor antagonist)